MSSTPDGKPVVDFVRKSAWANWLQRNHDKSGGVWLRLTKKASGIKSLSHQEALDVALCYGWIDGQSKGADERFWLQKFTPRGRRSMWSRRNRERVLDLAAKGLVQPAGLAEVERAKKDGRWEAAYDSPSRITVPDDLRTELERNEPARSFFETLDSQNRYAILFRLHTARKPETRAKRLRQFVEMLARKEKVYP